MNKAKNIVLTLAAASMLAACGNTAKTGAAYGMTHGAGYISKATVTVDGGKVTDATLVEVCLPDYVQPASASADTVEATVKSQDLQGWQQDHGRALPGRKSRSGVL